MNNNISSCYPCGLSLSNTMNNDVFNNSLITVRSICQAARAKFDGQVIPTNNTVNGGPIYYYADQNCSGTSVPVDAGQVIIGNVTGLTVKDIDFGQQNYAILIGYSSQILIENDNIVDGDPYGIYLIQSNNKVILNNTISDCTTDGIYVESSSNNVFQGNWIENCAADGLYLCGSPGSTLNSNSLWGCSINIDGDSLSFTEQTIPTNNSVNGRPVYYYEGENFNNGTMPVDAGELILAQVEFANM